MEGRPTVLLADLPGSWRTAVAAALSSAGCDVQLTDDRRELRKALDLRDGLSRVIVVGRLRQLNVGIGDARKVELDAIFPPDAPRPPAGPDLPRIFLVNTRLPDKILANRMRSRGVDSFLAREDPVATSCTAILNVAFEARVHKRVSFQAPVEVTTGDGRVHGRLTDLSEGGAELELPGRPSVRPSEVVTLSFGYQGVELTCAAEIRRVGARGSLFWRKQVAGVRFHTLDDDARGALQRMLDAARATG